MNLVVLCDFDGTVIEIDTCVFLLEEFAENDWRIFDIEYENGRISLEECIQRQLSMIRCSKHLILKKLEKVVSFRPNFKKLVNYCRAQEIPLVIVSAGLDFVIKHFLNKLSCSIKTYTAKARFTSKGIDLTFPDLKNKTSNDFKEDLVKHYKKHGYRVIYIGNGISDYSAIKTADFPLVIKDSKLADICKQEEIYYKEIVDFQAVVDIITHSSI